MQTSFVTCLIMGKDFSPRQLESLSKIELTSKNEKGELANFGRFKGQALPYGSAEVNIPINNAINSSQLSSALSILTNEIEHLRFAGVEEIYLTLNIRYKGQCNWEFTKEQIQKIADRIE